MTSELDYNKIPKLGLMFSALSMFKFKPTFYGGRSPFYPGEKKDKDGNIIQKG